MPRTKKTETENQKPETRKRASADTAEKPISKRRQRILDSMNQDAQDKPRKRRGPDPDKYGCEYVQPGENSRYLRDALVSYNLPPIDISDPKQVENRIQEYFNFCIERDKKPNIKALGNWIGVSDETVRRWRIGDYRSFTHCVIIKKAVDKIQELWWEYGQNGKMNPASWIFIGKNAFGMKDESEVIITPNNPLQGLDDKTAEKRILDSLPEPETEE